MDNISKLLVLVLIVAATGAMFYSVESESNKYANVATPQPAIQEQPSLQALTTQLLAAAKQYDAADDAHRSAKAQEMTLLVQQRKAALLAALKKDPGAVLSVALPADLRAILPGSIQALLETDAEISGTFSIIHIDRQETKNSEFDYQVKEYETGATYHLHFADGVPSATTGSKVKVNGVKIDDELAVAYAGGNNMQTTAAAPSSSSLGPQHSIVMLVNFTDNGSQPYTQSQVQGVMFTAQNSLNLHYQEDSYGQTSFDGDVTPWMTVPYTLSNVCSNYYAVMSAADSAAAKLGYTISNYSRKIYVFPNANCGFGGMSLIGGNPSWSLGMAYGQPYFTQIFEHELGHALGQNHASTRSCGAKAIDAYSSCTWSEYGENYDTLGYYNSFHSNPPHKVFFQWIKSANVVAVSASGTFTIAPIESQSAGAQVIRIAKPDTGEYYYVGYRQPIGSDTTLPLGITSGAVIHVSNLAGANTGFLDLTPGDGTYGNAALSDGRSFTDITNGITITQLSHTASGVTLDIQLTGPVCVRAAPAITMSPASQSGIAGSKKSYTVQVQNKDSSVCQASTFTLGNTVPAGWNAVFGATELSIAPGATGSTNLDITVASSAPDGTYTINASTADATVPVHSISKQASYIVFTDTTPPQISIISPSDGAKLRGSTLKISVSANDLSGIDLIRISMDSNEQKTCVGTTSCTASMQLKFIAVGSHTIIAQAIDTAGNADIKTISVSK